MCVQVGNQYKTGYHWSPLVWKTLMKKDLKLERQNGWFWPVWLFALGLLCVIIKIRWPFTCLLQTNFGTNNFLTYSALKNYTYEGRWVTLPITSHMLFVGYRFSFSFPWEVKCIDHNWYRHLSYRKYFVFNLSCSHSVFITFKFVTTSLVWPITFQWIMKRSLTWCVYINSSFIYENATIIGCFEHQHISEWKYFAFNLSCFYSVYINFKLYVYYKF